MNSRRTAAVLGLGLGIAIVSGIGANAIARAGEPLTVRVAIRYSGFEPGRISVPAGRSVTFVLANGDPIDHEWIVGEAASHQRHRTGSEPAHGGRPTEVSVAAGEEVRTTVTFDTPGTLRFICHLPGHEAYGMVGTLIVTN
ncbi:MAG TPA: plastocyanin/azurin family copper-binding protein [Candidatus Limnocylindrales bacterium]|nr:plastocyanin/azurin family copper-binding protein [Candidatus Limnocylindrales bacterium]